MKFCRGNGLITIIMIQKKQVYIVTQTVARTRQILYWTPTSIACCNTIIHFGFGLFHFHYFDFRYLFLSSETLFIRVDRVIDTWHFATHCNEHCGKRLGDLVSMIVSVCFQLLFCVCPQSFSTTFNHHFFSYIHELSEVSYMQ